MLVRVKKIRGTYGHVKNGTIVPKTFSSGAFEVTEEKGRELVSRGIVDVVGAANAPATKAPEPVTVPVSTTAEEKSEELAEMTLTELRAIARKNGMKGYAKLSKSELIRELETAEEESESPTFDATGGVE